jgi:hypothetical protein
MAARRTRLYTSVAALVRQLKKPNERIWHWSEYKPDEVDIRLISGRPRRSPRFPGGEGSGRSLHFRKRDGRWMLAGIGEWRT